MYKDANPNVIHVMMPLQKQVYELWDSLSTVIDVWKATQNGSTINGQIQVRSRHKYCCENYLLSLNLKTKFIQV